MSTMDDQQFLSTCHAADSRNRALEEVREKGADVVLSVFRLLKNSLVHAADNEAVLVTSQDSMRILSEFSSTIGGPITLTFAGDTIFVCGQLLRASRTTYEAAREVGQLLATVGVSEVHFAQPIGDRDLLEFAKVFSSAARNPEQRGLLLKSQLGSIRVRQVDTELIASDPDANTLGLNRMLRVYAAGLLLMRQYFERIADGKPTFPHRVKRLAQRLVGLCDRDEFSAVAITALAHAHRDDPGRALQAAVLSILVARTVTDRKLDLAQLAMSALLADSGRVKLGGKEALARFTPLGDVVERAVPTATTTQFISSGGVNLQNAIRTVIAYEATHIERAPLIGQPYDRTLSPLLQSRILHAVRRLLALLAPRDGGRASSALDALSAMANDRSVDETAYRLLIQGVGLLPTGTVVEFKSGAWGVVLGPSAMANKPHLPRVRVLTDAQGGMLSKKTVRDLGMDGSDELTILNVIEPSKARINALALVLEDEREQLASVG